MKKIVSVIIPAYNAEMYLSKCIESVLNQKNINLGLIEIIIGDDGSTDNTSKIIDEYKKKFPNIIVVDKHKNIGVAKTRNRGIELATGVYVTFLDADDWIDNDYIASYLACAEKSRADVVYAGYRRVNSEGYILHEQIPSSKPYGKFIVIATCSKFHRKQHIDDFNIRFPESKFGEDVLFTLHEITSGGRWRQLEYCGYNYLYNESSVTNSDQKEFTQKNKLVIERLIGEVLRIASKNLHKDEYRYFILKTMIYHMFYSVKTMTPTEFIDLKESLKSLSNRHHRGIYSFLTSLKVPPGESTKIKIQIAMIVFLDKIKILNLFTVFLCRRGGMKRNED